MEKDSYRILVVDDETDMLETCRKILSLQSYQVDLCESAAEALRLYHQQSYDLVIVDLRMPEMDGLELMKELHQIQKDQLVVFITAYASVENAMQAIRCGAFDFIRKPFKMDDFLVVAERALRFKALQDENRCLQNKLRDSFHSERIVGQSPAIKEALLKLRKVSEVDVPVLISGERGTGKELFAQTIHENSPRRNQAFVVVDCAALPEHLLESELFGYEKGAFTGAVQTKMGLMEVASGGTLFLDEIGEMSLNLQTKLLRALEEGVIRRLGGKEERKVDVRILAATNRSLVKMVEHGEFREDLYYRINVVQIVVPPLREREGDVPLLANYFFQIFRSKLTKKIEGISAAALIVLEQYDWPGNVRELRNAIQRACTLTESTHILPPDLPPAILCAVEQQSSLAGTSHFLEAKRALIEEFEKKYLREMLGRTQGNVTEAARFSGLSRPAFHRLMSKYGILSSEFKQSVSRR